MRKWLLVIPPLVLAVAEAGLLVFLGRRLGWLEVVLLVVLTALIGTMLVHEEGRRTIRGIQRTLRAGEPPTDGLIDGALILVAGALLVTPGLITDVIGFLFVFPVSRIPIRSALKKYVIVPQLDQRTGGMASGKVWTFGFPGPDEPAGVDPSDYDVDGRRRDEPVDLGDDEYDVD